MGSKSKKNSKAYYYRGTAYGKLEKYEKALNDLRKAIKLNPKYSKDAEFYYNLGTSYLHLEKYKQAIENYNESIKVNPKYTSTYKGRAAVYEKTGDYCKALEDYEKYLELSGKDDKEIEDKIDELEDKCDEDDDLSGKL